MLVDLGLPASTVTVVAQEPAPPPGKGAEFGKASPVALVLMIVMGLAVVLLIASMSKRIKRLPATFDKPAEPGAEDAGDNRP